MAFPDRLQEGLNFRNSPNLIILWAPNVLNPYKLKANVLHPVGEVIHTSHKQHRVGMIEGVEYNVVEHRLGKRLVTIDVVALDQYRQGFFARMRQIFDRRFYLGHDRDFPQPFTLINRTFVRDGSGFDKDAHVNTVLNRVRETRSQEVQVFPFTALFNRFLSSFQILKPNYSFILATN